MGIYATVRTKKRRALLLLNFLLFRRIDETLAKDHVADYSLSGDDAVIGYKVLRMHKGKH